MRKPTSARSPARSTELRVKSRKVAKAISTEKVSKPLSLKKNNEQQISIAVTHLRNADSTIRPLIDAFPLPTFPNPLTPKPQPFISLTKSIIFQQLATSAAKAIYARFTALLNDRIAPDAILSLSPHQLRAIGVSGRKAGYLHDLAGKFRNGVLCDEDIIGMSDDQMLDKLTAVKGIGVWSVHMFMIFGLGRLDVLPVGDLGVRKGVKGLYGLRELPNGAEMERVCEAWRPFRSVGAWYMWRFIEAKGILPISISSSVGETGLPEET